MDPNAPSTQTAKQQVSEVLRQASNIVITVGSQPTLDDQAAAIALAQIFGKLDKRAEAVVGKGLPKDLSFLPGELVSNKFQGLRDFVVELDVSKTEADTLRWTPPENKRLKIYITPYNGNFNKDDLSFSYGDYHCDAIVALGVNDRAKIDSAVGSQKQLLDKTKLITLTAGTGSSAQAGAPSTSSGSTTNQINWNEPTAISVCEMLMSLTEALQAGLLDNHIATSLLTGIVATTDHFTAANTTPKVMTMAAQLMAAGANQAEIVQNLKTPGAGKSQPAPKNGLKDIKPNQEAVLPHASAKKTPEPAAPVTAFAPPAPFLPKGEGPAPFSPAPSVPAIPFDTKGAGQAHSPMISSVRSEHDGNPFATVGGSPMNSPAPTSAPVINSTPANSSLVDHHNSIDVEAARRAVEAAASANPVPLPPPILTAPTAPISSGQVLPPQMPPTPPHLPR